MANNLLPGTGAPDLAFDRGQSMFHIIRQSAAGSAAGADVSGALAGRDDPLVAGTNLWVLEFVLAACSRPAVLPGRPEIHAGLPGFSGVSQAKTAHSHDPGGLFSRLDCSGCRLTDTNGDSIP